MSSSIFKLALSKEVAFRALKVSMVVGTILGFINHGSDIIANTLVSEQIVKIVITYFVPYSVSTYSSVCSILTHQKIKTNYE